MKFNWFIYGLALFISTTAFTDPARGEKCGALKNTVILVIRHAEKPDNGDGLSAAGMARAQAYVSYFKNFMVDGQPLKLNYLFAAADSKESRRPRLTLEPVSKSLGLAMDTRFKDRQFQALADAIKSTPHGHAILIVWHHGEIPRLVQALGADPSRLLPKGKWPEAVFNQLIELRYDSDGRLTTARCIIENFDFSR